MYNTINMIISFIHVFSSKYAWTMNYANILGWFIIANTSLSSRVPLLSWLKISAEYVVLRLLYNAHSNKQKVFLIFNSVCITKPTQSLIQCFTNKLSDPFRSLVAILRF